MAKKDFTADIISVIGLVKGTEETTWGKGVVKVRWGENPVTLDIRNININKVMNSDFTGLGKGISLSDEEADNVCNLLITQGYGSTEIIEKELSNRKARYTPESELEGFLD